MELEPAVALIRPLLFSRLEASARGPEAGDEMADAVVEQ
jgi:hypothetical protein